MMLKEAEVRTLSAEFQPFKQLFVFLEVVLFDVIEKFTTPTCHGDKPTTTVKVLAVSPQVLGEVRDALRKQGDLDFRGTRIFFVVLEVGYYGCFIELGFCHFID